MPYHLPMEEPKEKAVVTRDVSEQLWFPVADVNVRILPELYNVRSVIYCVKNITNGKMYVGQTINNVSYRLRGHVDDAFNKKCHYKLHSSMRKHGLETFVMCVAEVVPDENDLDAFEIAYIARYDTFKNGYNLTAGGAGLRGYVYTDEQRKAYSDGKKGKPISEKNRLALLKPIRRLDKETGEVLAVYGSYTEAHEDTGVNGITRCCRGSLPHAGGFRWEYVNEVDAKRGSWSKEATQKMSDRLQREQPLARRVHQVDLKTDAIIATFPSIKAANQAVGIKTVSGVTRGARKHAGGFGWRYAEDEPVSIGGDQVPVP